MGYQKRKLLKDLNVDQARFIALLARFARMGATRVSAIWRRVISTVLSLPGASTTPRRSLASCRSLPKPRRQ